MREYRCSSPSGPKRRRAFIASCDLPVPSLHTDPSKDHHSMQDATSKAATDLAPTAHHYLKLAAIIGASLELVLLFHLLDQAI